LVNTNAYEIFMYAENRIEDVRAKVFAREPPASQPVHLQKRCVPCASIDEPAEVLNVYPELRPVCASERTARGAS